PSHTHLYTTDHTLSLLPLPWFLPSFFFNDPPTTAIYTLSLHDALPILLGSVAASTPVLAQQGQEAEVEEVVVTGSRRAPRTALEDRKSTRLNSSHVKISYAVFCLKKKKKKKKKIQNRKKKTQVRREWCE